MAQERRERHWHWHRSRRRGGSARDPGRPLSAEERAERNVELTGDAIKVGVLLLLAVLIWAPLALVVLLVSGLSLGRRLYRQIVEPELRARFVEREVQKQVHATLSRERQVLEGQHARSLEELSASIAHEIRNPITAAKSLVQQMEEEPTAPENVEYARVALEELNRVERSVSHLLRFARDEEMSLAELRMADVVDSALETFRERLARSGIVLERQLDGEGVLVGDAEKLRRVVINLMGNAIEALEGSAVAQPRIAVELGENLAGSEVWVRVRDNGPGVDPQVAGRLFSPFTTSKAHGTGLGLAICRKLVEAHGGSIELRSQPGSGAELLVTLPKLPPRPPGAPGGAP